MKNSSPKLETDFTRTSEYMEKVVKTITKIRKTQLSFTMEDTQLSEYIDQVAEELVDSLKTD